MNETEKIDRITRKFASSRDISEDEADYIFIMKVIHRGYLDGKAWKPFFRAGFYYYDFTDLSRSLAEWYKLACTKLRNGYRGNFISTIPGRIFFAGSRNLDPAEEYARKAAEIAEETSFAPVRTNGLSRDFLEGVPTRYGMRSPGRFKDIEYIKSLMPKMKSMSLEEADNIYDLLKFHQTARQAFRLAHVTGRDGVFDVFAEWYRRAGELIEPGNFVHTVPRETCNFYQAKVHIRRCLKLLPYEPVSAFLHKKDVSVRDVPFDTLVVPYKDFVWYVAERYGFFARNGISFKNWRFLTSYPEKDNYDIKYFFQGNEPYGELMIIYKLKAMLKMSIRPALMDEKIFVKDKDYDRASMIMNVSEGDIAERFNPRAYSRYTRKEAYIDIITKLADERIAKKEYLDEGEWMEIER